MSKFTELKELIADAEADFDNHAKGNKAAGTRFRSKMNKAVHLCRAAKNEVPPTK